MSRERECATCKWFNHLPGSRYIDRTGKGICQLRIGRNGDTYAQYICNGHEFNFDESRDFMTPILSAAYQGKTKYPKIEKPKQRRVRHLKSDNEHREAV